jgi:hypothetical protein
MRQALSSGFTSEPKRRPTFQAVARNRGRYYASKELLCLWDCLRALGRDQTVPGSTVIAGQRARTVPVRATPRNNRQQYDNRPGGSRFASNRRCDCRGSAMTETTAQAPGQRSPAVARSLLGRRWRAAARLRRVILRRPRQNRERTTLGTALVTTNSVANSPRPDSVPKQRLAEVRFGAVTLRCDEMRSLPRPMPRSEWLSWERRLARPVSNLA